MEESSLNGQPDNKSDEILHACSRVGLFDSGVGGLSVLKQLQHFAGAAGRQINFVYFGDTARCPYGNRNPAEITTYVREIVSWLQRQQVDVIVMACNTSAALAYDSAVHASRVPVLDLISPTANSVAKTATRVGVMATASTVRSKAFSKAIQAIKPAVEVVEIGCPELVPIVESGRMEEPAVSVILSRYINELKEQDVDALILGCTHFPFLRKTIAGLLGEKVALIDPAQVLTNGGSGVLKQFLSQDQEVVNAAAPPLSDLVMKTEFFVTGDPQSFALSAEKCLGQPIDAVNQIELEQLAKLLAAEVAEETLLSTHSVVQSLLSPRG